jgi:hypothetical protein
MEVLMKSKTMVLAVALTAALGGCGAQDVPSASLPVSSVPTPSLSPSLSPSPSPSPSLSPSPSASPSKPVSSIPVQPGLSGPPNGPTDQMKKTAFVVGTVTSDSSGPCYGLETDEGTQYALHASTGIKLVKGARMRIKTAPAKVRMDCGPGKLLEMVSSELLR